MKDRHAHFANYIKSLRKVVGLTQLQLSEKSGLAKSTISGIENGRFIPSEDGMEKLAEILDVSIEEMMMKKLEDKSAEQSEELQKHTSNATHVLATKLEDEDEDEHEALKSQLILIDRFNKLSKKNQKQLLDIAQVLVNNQVN